MARPTSSPGAMPPIEPAGCDLLLLRHGIAEERRPDRPDALRALTAAGRDRTAAVIARLVELRLEAHRMLSSPLVRARQTAELALTGGLAPSLEEHQALAPGGDALAALGSWLEGLPPGERLLLVGHEPDLGDLAARLIGAAPGSLVLKKAGITLLQGHPSPLPGSWRLRLLLGPRQMLLP